MTRHVPHDLEAERSVLGAMMLTGDALAGGVNTCTPADFYRPAHGHCFAAMLALYRQGEKVDAVTIADQMGRDGTLDGIGGLIGLTDILTAAPSSDVHRYAQILARHAMSRRLIRVAADLAEAAYQPDTDPYDLAERTQAEMSQLAMPAGQAPKDVTTWDMFWDRPGETHKPWVIYGLLRVGWKAVIVAGEGSGKTLCASQIALCAGQGIHPFTFAPIEPVRSLFVDLENPEEHIDLRGNLLRPRLIQVAGDMYRSDRTWLWHRPGGINLRSRAGRASLEAAIQHVRPQLVVIAPVYKTFRQTKGETDEMASGELQDVLDGLRTRYEFALLLEHHAPKGITRARDMVPFGSSLWLRWPELGLALLPPTEKEAPKGALTVGRYRPDRLPCTWPDRLERGDVWPWMGVYRNGIPAPQLEEAF